jgi:SAM-dependent methyltransferase
MTNLLKSLSTRVANSYRVRKLLSRLGLPDHEPAFYPHWEPLIPPRRLWVWSSEPLSQFFRWAWAVPTYLNLLCDLRRDSSVLELGCSHGRTMLPLADYLQPPGRYEGLDILPEQIEFAQKNIHARYPHINFTLADVHHSYYQPQGRAKPEDYRFPYPDNAFNVVYAASLFTHLGPPAAANYFKQSSRVLRPGGRSLFSFFLLDYYHGPGTTTSDVFRFSHTVEGWDGVRVRDPERPDLLVAYQRAFIEQLGSDAGLRVSRVIPGCWSKHPDGSLFEQDLVVLEAV